MKFWKKFRLDHAGLRLAQLLPELAAWRDFDALALPVNSGIPDSSLPAKNLG